MNKIKEHTDCIMRLADFALPSVLIGTAGAIVTDHLLKYHPHNLISAIAFSTLHLCERYRYQDVRQLKESLSFVAKSQNSTTAVNWNKQAFIKLTKLTLASLIAGYILRLNPIALAVAVPV